MNSDRATQYIQSEINKLFSSEVKSTAAIVSGWHASCFVRRFISVNYF